MKKSKEAGATRGNIPDRNCRECRINGKEWGESLPGKGSKKGGKREIPTKLANQA